MDVELMQPQGTLFDYDSLEAEARIVIQQRASEIKTLAKRVAADIVEIGGKLAEVKDRLGGNGKFSSWLHGELGWSDRTAGNFIAVWQKFEGQNLALENFATSALYLLAAPSTPGEAVEAARQLAEQGERVTHTVAKQIVERAKAKRPRQQALVDPVEPAVVKAPEPADVEAVSFVEAEPAGEVEEEPVSYVDGKGVAHHRIPTPSPIDAEASPAPTPKTTTVVAHHSAPKPDDGPKDLPAGWIFDSTVEEGYRAIQPERKLQTLLFAGKREALVAAHQIQASLSDGTAGLAGRSLVAPAAPAAVAIAPPRPKAWYSERIEISIALMPCAGPTEERKVLFSVHAGERMPFYAMSVGEVPLEQLPPKIQELLEKLTASLAVEPASKKAEKKAPASPAVTKRAAKAAKKPAAKAARK